MYLLLIRDCDWIERVIFTVHSLLNMFKFVSVHNLGVPMGLHL